MAGAASKSTKNTILFSLSCIFLLPWCIDFLRLENFSGLVIVQYNLYFSALSFYDSNVYFTIALPLSSDIGPFPN